MTGLAMVKVLVGILALTCFGQAFEEDVGSALWHDDQCVSEEGGHCVLNALQMMSSKHFDEHIAEETGIEEQEMMSHDKEEGQSDTDRWLKDISTKTKNKLKKALAPLQKPIVAEYKALSILDKFANYTMEKVENATGQKILWNKKGLGLLQVGDAATTSRRRRRGGKSLPPRARYVSKIIIYLEKEVQAVWNMHAIVDRKRWGIGDVITASPYGPHGEHPDAWKPNGSFPMSLVRPSLSSNATIHLPKVKEVKFTNKYAQQLQEDYEALVRNIVDAKKKTADLQDSLGKMDGYADEFISSPSGVFNRIKTQ